MWAHYRALTIMAHNLILIHTDRILMIVAPFEREDSGLSNGAKIIKIRYVLRKLGPKVIGALLGARLKPAPCATWNVNCCARWRPAGLSSSPGSAVAWQPEWCAFHPSW